MKIKTKILFIAALLFSIVTMDARNNPEQLEKMKDKVQFSSARMNCQPAQANTDLEINNVRARLLTGGDIWWNKEDGRYIVPKPAPGFDEVSSIFAGGVWIGGVDPNGSLKLAGVQYATGANTDWYPGPLDDEGQTDATVCENWDQFFSVKGADILKHIAAYDKLGDEFNCDDIPDAIKYWPARGNPYWRERFDFDLPDQNLADFWDEDGDGYDPCQGDFPVIDIVGCEAENRGRARELLPDEVVFWLYNDNGGVHGLTNATAIQMEVQVQAFGYATNDEVNDMTFYRYKLINKATDDIRDCYFAMWVDPDLGCSEDDYIGCDVERSLGYVYNEDATDGSPGIECNGVLTYKNDVPILGIDYFRGPRAPRAFCRDENDEIILNEDSTVCLQMVEIGTGEGDTLIELGMTSFVYQNRGVSNPPPATTDPNQDTEFYNILRGLWSDGTAVSFGDSGFDPAKTDTVRYVFPDAPDDENGWSMCTADLPFDDRRTVQATGPLLLQPGAKNELIIGAVFVPSITYPCPSIDRLQFADDLAQALFDNCFDITDGPDAPDMYGVELDRQLVLLLSNDSIEVESNNAREQYLETDLQAPKGEMDSLYRFEGYKIYQLANPNVSVQQLDDIGVSRLIRQVDVKNGVDEIFNWFSVPNPDDSQPPVWIPERQVDGDDGGIKHSFNVRTDQFANGDRTLINHKNYYYTVLAYAYNNYKQFDLSAEEGIDKGQNKSYLEGRRNVQVYTFTPRPVVYKELQTAYGQEAAVTRVQGVGTGVNALVLEDGTMEAILDGSIELDSFGTDGTALVQLTYKAGNGPINPTVIDPLNIKDGAYRLEIVGAYDDAKLDPKIALGENANGSSAIEKGARWVLTNTITGEVIASEKSIEQLNEQIIYGQGFSLSVNQVGEPGSQFDESNGAITQVYEYADGGGIEWFNAVPAFSGTEIILNEGEDDEFTLGLFGYVNSDVETDPKDALSTIDDGYFVPMRSTRYIEDAESGFYLTPGWKGEMGKTFSSIASQNKLQFRDLNNVNIVFTSDKSKWSECIVVETAVEEYEDINPGTIGEAEQFDLRQTPSIDENGVPTGALDEDGNIEMGKSYFPGYAIDVETGERLNIFFGENSIFTDEADEQINTILSGFSGWDGIRYNTGNGDDLIWNPSTELFARGQFQAFGGNGIYDQFVGGQHYIYVTRQPYDGCDVLYEKFESSSASKNIDGVAVITWTAMPVPMEPLLSLEEGLIPNDLTVRLRVQNGYNKELDLDKPGSSNKFVGVGALPVYEFAFGNVEARDVEPAEFSNALDNVQIVPNPYYAYSAYEQNQFENIIKVTNLPTRAIVTIYTLDGKFIQQFNRDAMPFLNDGNNPALAESQIAPALEWNLTNNKGIPIASGVYIFHISAPDLGIEKSLKWFGVNRRFDPTGL
ncbi:MAG: hypothetical protein ACI9P5_000417 [Saprospiraceae bacterium]|jgi:hypothetical protein|tara:strand:+ start:206 stop:4429 length:4224 start_codon:yes stop_codon:yes gene_type:complete